MKYFIVILISVFSIFSAIEAQNLKWGKPSQVEWDLIAWGAAPDAEAVVLNKSMAVTYEISKSFADRNSGNLELSASNVGRLGSNINQAASMTYDNRLRIKILKDTGSRFANIDIIYYEEAKNQKEYDELDHLKVIVFNRNEKGKVSRRIIKNDSFTFDRINDHYKVMHVRVPDVKAGDIIEYQYVITSSRVAFLYDFSFIENIPILHAKCDMDIPAFLQFDMKVPIHPYIKSNVERGTVRTAMTMGDYQEPKSFATNHYIIEAQNILPKDLEQKRFETDATDKGEDVSALHMRLMKTHATIKNVSAEFIAPMPIDMEQLMIGR